MHGFAWQSRFTPVRCNELHNHINRSTRLLHKINTRASIHLSTVHGHEHRLSSGLPHIDILIITSWLLFRIQNRSAAAVILAPCRSTVKGSKTDSAKWANGPIVAPRPRSPSDSLGQAPPRFVPFSARLKRCLSPVGDQLGNVNGRYRPVSKPLICD